MNTRWKTLIIAALCIVWGLAFFVSCSSSKGFDWSRLSLQKYERKSYSTDEVFQAVKLVIDTDDVTILPSADNTAKVEYVDSNVLKYDISVSDGTLNVKMEDHRKWYHHINVYSPSNALTIYLPEKEYTSLNIQSDTSDITIADDLTLGALEIQVSTGNLSLSNLTCNTLAVTVSTGDVSVSNLNISGDLYAKSDTGDKEFNNVSCNNATIIASTGKTSVSQMKASGDVSVESDTGRQSFYDLTCNNATLISETGDKEISSLTAFGNLTVESDTGDNLFSNSLCDDLTVTTSTGKQTYTAFSCASTKMTASTGDISMTDFVASKQMEINTSTGDVSFDRCDAASLAIQTGTGSVTGTFRTPKVFYAQSSSGKIEVPASTEGGLCQVQTNTGKVKLSIAE